MRPAMVIPEQRAGRGHTYSGKPIHEINWKNPADDDLVAFVEGQARNHDTRHYAWIKRAKVQLAWAAGDQLKVWDKTAGRLMDSPEVITQSISLFVNRIKPAILNWISLITARPLSFRVQPATSDDVDIASARVQDKLARYYWKKLLGDTLFIDTLWMMFCTGCAFLKSTWDPSKGDEFSVGPKDLMDNPEQDVAGGNGLGLKERFRQMIGQMIGVPVEDESLNADGEFGVATGDLVCGLLTGFDVIPPYRATGIEDSSWTAIRQLKPLEDLLATYGSKAAGLVGGKNEPFFTYQDLESTQIGTGGRSWSPGGGFGSPQQSQDHVLVYELWRPRLKGVKGLENGHHSVIAQQQVLKSGPNPYDHGEIPLIMLRELPSPKQYWPPSTIQDLMPVQAEANITRTQIAIHKNATINPTIIAEKGVGLGEMAFTVAGQIVEVNPGKIDKVKPWVPEPLPAYVHHLIQLLGKDFDDLSRNHAASYGKQTGSVKSGKHVLALQEADTRLNAPMMRLLRDKLGHVCRQWMSLLKQYVNEQRVTTIIGDSNEPEVLMWNNEDLPSAEFNVECDLGPSMDRQTTIETIDMMTARGWMNPQRRGDREMVFRWLGQGVAQEVDETQQDRANAAIENQKLLQGVLPSVVDGDEDTTHLEEHNRAMKGGNFRRAVKRQPEIELLFETHTRNHERKRLEKEIRQKIAAAEISIELAEQAGLPVPGMDQDAQGGQGRQKPGRPGGSGGGSGGRPSGKPSGSPPQAPEHARRASNRAPPAGYRKSRAGVYVPS